MTNNQKGVSAVIIILIAVAILVIVSFFFINQSQKSSDNKNLSPKVATEPEAPKGFIWKTCENMNARFLLPNGWYFKEENSDKAMQCFFSRESIDKDGSFRTGLSVQALHPRKTGAKMKPTDIVKTMSSIFTVSPKTHLEIISSANLEKFIDETDLKYYRRFNKLRNNKAEDVDNNELMLGDDVHDTVYYLWFESPATLFEKDFEDFGKTMISNLQISVNEPDYINLRLKE